MPDQQSRDEINRCREALGWSWATLGERVGLTMSQVMAVKGLKRELPAADVAWLQRLAAVFDGMPRDGEALGAPQWEGDDMAVREAVIDAAVELYADSSMLGGEEGAGARHVLGELLNRLGWLDEARARLRVRALADVPADPEPKPEREPARMPMQLPGEAEAAAALAP